ncbi:hypothetical protein E4U43_001431 [Claviceps pusilla]|uniref:Agmatinase n=1 Tax=Claviceps pusilla TaxID=123648 RepID=A0A9P7N8Z4_9HYPO|nr:hypothetical protein E4U43_001431 [Claviceps pusilla]
MTNSTWTTTLGLVCLLLALASPGSACGGGHDDVKEWTREELAELEAKWGFEWSYTGIGSFAHLDYVKCLTNPAEQYDIAIIGAPFDTAVSYRPVILLIPTTSIPTSFLPGARFGPRAIRQASARQTSFRGFNPRAGINPYQNWARVIDCGDMPITPFDNDIAREQMTQAFKALGAAPASSSLSRGRPKLVTLGGDHSLSLPALRALRDVYGQPVRVLHFDGLLSLLFIRLRIIRHLVLGAHCSHTAAHLDTWDPAEYPSHWGSTHFNHGSMFWMAGQEGLLSNASSAKSVHAGLRTRLSGNDWADHEADTAQNWVRFSADAIDDMGTRGLVEAIMSVLGTQDPVYLSVDIDVLDPAFAPGTGTPEPGGWTTRELIRILRGLEGLNVVGADVVEVSPAYQGRGEETALAAAQVVYEIVSSMVKKGLEGMGRDESGEEKMEL